MNKPISLKIHEFQQEVSHVIQNSELPIYILKYQNKNLLSEIEKAEENFAQKEISEYYKSQEQSEEETPTET